MVKRRQLTKDRVLETAVDLAEASGGVDELTLTALAAELDVRVPSLYNHIDGLDGLREDLALLTGRRLLAEILQAAFGKTGAEALRAMAQAYRDFALRNPAIYPLTTVAPEPEQVELTALAQEWLQLLLLTVASLGLMGDEALHAIRAFRSMLHGFVSLESEGGFKMGLDRDESFDYLVSGFISCIGERGVSSR
ncbi:MAG: TetR/AcrR family transcriptional regulator [Candidatus Promineifilaceae bacterium]|jgi:AcrR family transcriptional regulator